MGGAAQAGCSFMLLSAAVCCDLTSGSAFPAFSLRTHEHQHRRISRLCFKNKSESSWTAAYSKWLTAQCGSDMIFDRLNHRVRPTFQNVSCVRQMINNRRSGLPTTGLFLAALQICSRQTRRGGQRRLRFSSSGMMPGGQSRGLVALAEAAPVVKAVVLRSSAHMHRQWVAIVVSTIS